MAKKIDEENSAGLRQKTHETVDKIMDKSESMRDNGKKAMSHVKEDAIMIKGNIDSYIRNNPEQSVLIAAGIGAVVGVVLTALMTRKH
ncbi:hypothetical protein K9M79_01735 [Candidatus Woesearchaeota archaeon]|nr:hypothetical protein [Candidatus Woesearchaeota archaeon]